MSELNAEKTSLFTGCLSLSQRSYVAYVQLCYRNGLQSYGKFPETTETSHGPAERLSCM
jgi:hypothetical protein